MKALNNDQSQQYTDVLLRSDETDYISEHEQSYFNILQYQYKSIK